MHRDAARIEKIRSPGGFDLVISDIRMGGKSGLDLLREIRKRAPETEVILMTGFGSMETAVEAVREARLCTDDSECDMVLCDVSLNGAKIATDADLAEDLEVAIFVGGLHPLTGRIRWCHDRHAGVQFDVPIPMSRRNGSP